MFKINEYTNLKQDPCYINQSYFSREIEANYNFPKYLSDIGSRDKYFDSVNQPGLFQTGNYSGYPNNINNSSYIRNGKIGNIYTHGKGKIQLNTNFLNPPYMANRLDPKYIDNVSKIESGEIRNSGLLREREINTFVPLLDDIRVQIQNPKNLIPEYWVRGGMDTKAVIRNIDYLKSCGIKQ